MTISKPKILLVVALTGLAAACGPQKHHDRNGNQADQNITTMQQNGMGRHRGGKVRQACATEIQTYCASADRVGKCLNAFTSKLGTTCQAAMAEQRQRRQARRQNNGMQQNQNGQRPLQTTTPPSNTTNKNDDDE